MTVQLSPRFLAVCAAVALLAAIVGWVAVGGSGDEAGIAVAAATVTADRQLDAAARAGTTTTALLPSTSAAPGYESLTGAPPPDPVATDGTSAETTAASRPPPTTPEPPPTTAAPTWTTPPTTAAPAIPAAVAPPVGATSIEPDGAARIEAHHNRERVGRGLAPLTRSSCLDAVAAAWAARLASEGDLQHNPSAPAQTDACMAWQAVGENVGFDGTVEAITRAWMASVIHRANILGPAYSQIGVGVVRRDGFLWVVVNFAG